MRQLKIKNALRAEILIGNILLLLPGISYWTSAVMSAAMGTDYFYDVVFAQLKINLTGKLIFGLIVLILPIITITFNTTVYKRNIKLKWLKWYIALGGVMTMAGVLALWRLFMTS
jgi:hypothetical protein